MPRKTAFLILIAFFATATANAAMSNLFRRRSAGDWMFPRTGDVPNLVLASRRILT